MDRLIFMLVLLQIAAVAQAPAAPVTVDNASHVVSFHVAQDSFSARAAFSPAKDSFSIKAVNGAACQITQTPRSLTLTGVDEKGKKFTLTFTVVGQEVEGSLQIGTHNLRARGSAKEVFAKLDEQIKATPGLQELLPTGTTLGPVADQMRANPSLVGSLVGHGKPPVELRKTYCEAVCDCCAGGGTFSPWCCISCASCDYFKVNLTDVAIGRIRIQ